MPVLVTDNIQLKIQLSQLRDLLIEELILPCTWRQIGQTDPKQTHSISTATSLPEQIQRFPKEDLIHIQWSVQSPHASMGDKVRVAHLYRHRPRLQPATAQTTTNIFCQVKQRGLQEGGINGVFIKSLSPGRQTSLLPYGLPDGDPHPLPSEPGSPRFPQKTAEADPPALQPNHPRYTPPGHEEAKA